VKPPRGSNVTGGEVLSTLLLLEDVAASQDLDRMRELEQKLDDILDGSVDFPQDVGQKGDHDYLDRTIDESALTVFAGCIARKVCKLKPASTCQVCSESLLKQQKEAVMGREEFLQAKSRGGLLWPSEDLYQLLHQVRLTRKCISY